MDRGNGKRFDRVHRWWLIALVALIALPAGFVTARQAVFDQRSPATGHAQVTTQGISKLPTGQVVWRVVERIAKPRGQAEAGKRTLSFILATEEPVLLTNVSSSGKSSDVARLAPGESYLVKKGTNQIAASLSDQEVTYIAIELVPVADANDIDGGTLLFVSTPFTAPSGERDLDLVRNVLVSGEKATLPDTGQSVAILATEGSIDILPAGGSSKKLDAGEGDVFAPGDLEIAAADSTASAAAVRAQFAAITSSLQQGDGSQAAYVVAVIGPEIPPPPTPTPVPTDTPPPTWTPTPAPEPTETPVALGAISATIYNCPQGMTLETLEPDNCKLATDGYELSLDGPDGGHTLADAENLDGGWQWRDLPLGTYRFAETSLPLGYDDYVVPGSAAVGGSSTDGYTIAIDESAPEIGVQLYNVRAAPKTGSITIALRLCPQGHMPNDYNPADCVAPTGGFSISLLGTSTQTRYDMSEAVFAGGVLTWNDLPLDSYAVTVESLPRGWTTVLWPDGATTPVGSGETVAINDQTGPDLNLPLYAFFGPASAG